jgi:hypothetical protein
MANLGRNANCSGPTTAGGYNLEYRGNSCGFSNANHSLVNTDPDSARFKTTAVPPRSVPAEPDENLMGSVARQ